MLSLFRVWPYKEGARLMKVEDTWGDLISEKPLELITAPFVFSLDDVPARLGLPNGCKMYQVQTHRAPLRGAWWQATWLAACAEVRRRYGQQLRIKCAGVREDGTHGSQIELNHTMS